MAYLFWSRLLLIGLLLGSGLEWSVVGAEPRVPLQQEVMHGGGSSSLPNAQPSALARRVSDYMSGHWQVVGNSQGGSRLLQGKVMVRKVGAGNYLSIRYQSHQYSDLNTKDFEIKSRHAYMMLYFEKNNRFNILSFRDSGKIKQYRGLLSKEGDDYRFVSDPFKMGPLRGQVTFTVSPLNKNKYIERFYFNVLLPGSDAVMKTKMVANLVFTKDQKWEGRKHKKSRPSVSALKHKRVPAKKNKEAPEENKPAPKKNSRS